MRHLFYASTGLLLLIAGCSVSSKPLSNEETAILLKVAPANEYFYWTRFDGVLEVYIEGNDVVPNQQPKTIEAWSGAIESLEQRGFISGEGLKAGVFVLTKEGRSAAKELLDRSSHSDSQIIPGEQSAMQVPNSE